MGQITLEDAIRRCELEDILIAFSESEDFDMFIRLFSNIKSSNSVLVNNLKLLYEYLLENDIVAANVTLSLMYGRKHIFFEDRVNTKIFII